MATKHEREANDNSTGLAEAAIAAVARSRELGQGRVATLEGIAEMNAPAHPAPRPGQPDLPADQLPALEPLALKAYSSNNKHVARMAVKAHQLHDMNEKGSEGKELQAKKIMINKHWGSLHQFIDDPTAPAAL